MKLTLTGTNLTGKEWITRLEKNGHVVSTWAKDILNSKDYNENHRLEKGRGYEITLIKGKDMPNNKRTTRILQETYGVAQKAEMALLIREKLTNKELQDMDLNYIIVLHEPIVDSDGSPSVLFSIRRDSESFVDAGYDDPDDYWVDGGAFAFMASTLCSNTQNSLPLELSINGITYIKK